MDRNDFIKTALLGIPALSSSLSTTPKTPPPTIQDGENYWNFVRSQFPLSDKISYLNNGTMGVSPFSVIDAVTQKSVYVNTEGHYGGGEHEAIKALARFIGADEDEIAFTHNVTEGNNIIAQGLKLSKGDEVIMTKHEHVGGALPWLNRAKHDGIVLKTFDLGSTTQETIQNLEKKITKKTKAFAIPHIPCTIGQVLPVKEISALARSRGIYSFFDGAHGTGMLDLNLHEMGCDFYSSCCHKWMLGPKGTGFVYIKKSKLDSIKPILVGAYSDSGWDMLSDPPAMKGYVDSAHRYFYGTQSAELYEGILAAIKFHESIGKQVIENRVKFLSEFLYSKLREMEDKVEMVTPEEAASRAAVTAFRMKNMSMQDFQKKAQKEKIIIRIVPENEVNCIRVSTHIYNLLPEINKLIDLVRSA